MKTGRLAGGTDTTYVYNALGQRVKKSGGAIASPIYFMYDEAGHLVGEYASAGNLIQETVWLGDIPVATLRPNGANVDVFYVHTDQLNTPRKISRPSDNALRWRWDPTPFGEGTTDQNPAGIGTFVYNLRFPGQQFDIETNLNYNYLRDYDPVVGRFVQSDPAGLGGGLNTYWYADAAPAILIDPAGLSAAAIPLITPVVPPWVVGGAWVAGPAAAGWAGWQVGSDVYSAHGVWIGDQIDKVCRVAEKSRECDKEWEDAFRDCKRMLASPNPPRGVTGGYQNLYDCARGLVSERCGGNRIGAGSSNGGKWRGKGRGGWR
jgi:RHS repeat-associated protein